MQLLISAKRVISSVYRDSFMSYSVRHTMKLPSSLDFPWVLQRTVPAAVICDFYIGILPHEVRPNSGASSLAKWPTAARACYQCGSRGNVYQDSPPLLS